MMEVLAIVLMVGGAFFLTAASVGLIRLPDFYARSHATGKAETLGAVLILAGLIVYGGWTHGSIKLVLVLLFVALANPTATHAVLTAALGSGLDLWTRNRPITGQEQNEEKGRETEHGVAT
jgi:multicomponent Na+:H+ antiporter subunit G